MRVQFLISSIYFLQYIYQGYGTWVIWKILLESVKIALRGFFTNDTKIPKLLTVVKQISQTTYFSARVGRLAIKLTKNSIIINRIFSYDEEKNSRDSLMFFMSLSFRIFFSIGCFYSSVWHYQDNFTNLLSQTLKWFSKTQFKFNPLISDVN